MYISLISQVKCFRYARIECKGYWLTIKVVYARCTSCDIFSRNLFIIISLCILKVRVELIELQTKTFHITHCYK